MSNYEAPKIYQVLKDINPKNVIASTKAAALYSSIVQSNQNYHHNMGFPCSDKEKGVFNMSFPQMITSSINETTGEDGVTKSYPFFGEVYGNYNESVKLVNDEIDKIIKVGGLHPESSTKEQYTELFLTAMVERKKEKTKMQLELEAGMEETGKEMDDELFRYIALKVLIEDEIVKDQRGTALRKAMEELRRCYCESLDTKENQDLKQKIFLGIGLTMKDVKKPTTDYLPELIKYQTFPNDHKTMPTLIDYSKGPQLPFKLMVSVPKKEEPKKICLSTTGQVLWTTIYDYQNNPLGKTGITTYQQLERFIYRKGESKLGKPQFKLLQAVTTNAPSVYWAKRVGVIQLKATVCKVFDLIEMSFGSHSLSHEEAMRDLQEARESMEYFNLHRQQEQQQQQQQSHNGYEEHHDADELDQNHSHDQNKRDRDASDQDAQGSDDSDVDRMINEDYELNQSATKKR